MVKDAEAHASEDHARREGIEKKNQLDSMVYQAEKTVAESGESIPVVDKNEVDEAIANAKKALEGDDRATLDAAHQRLEGALHKVAEHLYKQQAASAGGDAGAAGPDAGASGTSGGGGDDVIDAEYTEEN